MAKPVRRLAELKGFKQPTPPQEKAIPEILAGKNVLIIAPTATGKTEAAILPILSMLVEMPEKPPGVKILYITPLRALNRDLLERLEWWCTHLDIRLSVRHGDTDRNERTKQARRPPDLLITTPETLQAILPARIMGKHLKSVRWVIVDEIHEMVDSKRGSQLSLALERLRRITGVEPQLIGLSATIGEPEKVAKFLVGVGRDVKVVKVPVARQMRLSVVYPEPTEEDHRLAAKLYTHPEVAARLRVIRRLLRGRRSTLLFTNTRSISEVLASRFRVWDIDLPLSIHHGSLSKPSRLSAERGLKNGELKALVCTSSLELGIDVGRIDLVIQYMSPRQVTRLVQRVGRSGHRIGRVAEGVTITMDSDDTLEAMVVSRRALNEEMEPVRVPECPYDALCHQIAGLLLEKRRWELKEILELFRRAYPYRNLTMEDLRKVVDYMHNRTRRLAWFAEEDLVILKPRNSRPLYRYYFEHLSMIPDEKQYLVVDEEDDSPIGILDEAFMAEYGKPGVKFIIRGSPWVIVDLVGDKVYVRRDDDPTGAIPSWVGEEIPVPFEVAREVGSIRAYVEEALKSGVSEEEIAEKLSEEYPADVETALRAIRETVEQFRRGLPIPTDRRIVVEGWENYVIIHAHLGTLTNRSLAYLVGHLISQRTGLAIPLQHDPYRILIQTGGGRSAQEVADLLRELASLPESSREDRLEASTIRTGIFKRRTLHVAKRFGAIKKWADLSSISLKSLLRSFEGTAIYEEALK
ncbi:ATP-dependent helicase, partial [Candidatus Bathyarchaeota archaeon]